MIMIVIITFMVYLTMHVCKDTAQKRLNVRASLRKQTKNNSLKQDDF